MLVTVKMSVPQGLVFLILKWRKGEARYSKLCKGPNAWLGFFFLL